MTITWRAVDSFPGNRSSDATTESRPCPICGSNRSRTVLQFDQFQFYSDSDELSKRVDIREVQCLNCFALYLNPCYSDYGFKVLFAEAGCSYGASAGRPTEQIQWLGSRGLLRPGTCFLDAGCYDGGFLAKLPEGLEKIGVDIDEPAIARGRERYGSQGIEFIVGDFRNFCCEKRIDTITMFHVLEHLPTPVEVLRHLRSVAHPETRLVIEVPILENGLTNDINGFFSVQHMTHFSRASLENCLTLGGWEISERSEQPDYNGCRVLASPAESPSPTAQDQAAVALLHTYLAHWHKAIRDVERRIGEMRAAKKCIIWGGGLHTEFLYQTTSLFGGKCGRQYVIVDSDRMKKGKSWRGIEIHHPDVLRGLHWADECLLVSSYGGTRAIAKAAGELGVPNDRVFTLYDEVRVY